MTDLSQEIASELEDVAMQLAGRGLLEEPSSEACQVQANEVVAEFQRLQLMAEMLEYQPLQPLSCWLIENTELATKTPATFQNLQNEGHFYQWAELLAASIRGQDTLLLPDLTSALTDSAWPLPFPKTSLEQLLLALADPATMEQAVPAEGQAPSTPAPVSKYTITWDEDVHPEILDAFLSDTPDQIVESTALIHKIAQGKASKDEHQLAARLTHTIKGASGVVGVTSMIAFTHQLEEILEYSVNHTLPKQAQELLSASADCLDNMSDAMLQRQALPSNFKSLLEQLEVTAKQLNALSSDTKQDDLEALDEIVFSAPPEKLKTSLPEQAFSEQTLPQSNSPQEALPQSNSPQKTSSELTQASKNTDSLALSTELLASQMLFEPLGHSESQPHRALASGPSIRVPISLIDNLLNLAEELVTSTSQVNDRVKHILTQSQQIRQQDERMSRIMDELEQSIDQQFRQLKQPSEKTEAFDQLELEVYNELHSIHSLLSETVADNRDIERSMQQNLHELSDQLHSQQRINRELNTTILDTRMESLDTLTPRLERIVRETCRSTGKHADLIITGSDLAVDTDILKGLTDPLLHLLRNSVDHGIEDSDTRRTLNKPETGHIELSFKQEGRYVTMRLKDDGQGMDPEVIYQRALAQSIISPDLSLSDNEKLQLILLAGFTTRESVSDISGRGVGMDVVKDAVSRLRGSLALESTPAEGSTISIRLPLTLVAANTLMAKVAGHIVAIPVDSIDQLHALEPSEILTSEDQLSAHINDKLYHVRQLSQLLGWGNPKPDNNIAHSVILVNHDQQPYALLVDAILQPREVVVKSLSPWLNNVPGINGACLLSDGAVAAVLDLPRLFEFDQPAEITHFEKATKQQTAKLVLVVDDSLSNRKALSVIAEQLGYRTVTAMDGEEALQVIGEEVPDIILSDLEMPRMNGLELVQSIRKMDNAQHLPFIMITSRATIKHRKQAKLAGVNDYLVKPVDRETLQNHLEKWLN